jgi:hypothetical protein
MRKSYFVLLVQFMFMTATAQSSVNLGLSYGRGFSYPKYSPFTRASGISAEFTRPLITKTDIRLSAAWEGTGPIIYREQGPPGAISNFYDSYAVIPFRVGLQRYIHGESAFVFAETGIGMGFFPHDKTGETNTRVNISYAFGGGYRHHLNERRYLQASLSYNRNPYKSSLPFSFSWMLLRVAYGLKWGNKD